MTILEVPISREDRTNAIASMFARRSLIGENSPSHLHRCQASTKPIHGAKRQSRMDKNPESELKIRTFANGKQKLKSQGIALLGAYYVPREG